jgi:hypothetical protein
MNSGEEQVSKIVPGIPTAAYRHRYLKFNNSNLDLNIINKTFSLTVLHTNMLCMKAPFLYNNTATSKYQ